MKLIIAGSRHLDHVNSTFIVQTLAKYHISYKDIDEVVSGCSGSVDRAGSEWAARFSRPCKSFPPDWDTFGKGAGPVRNRKMADYGTVLLLIWDGKSKGSANMLEEMQTKNKPIYEVIIPNSIYNEYNTEDWL